MKKEGTYRGRLTMNYEKKQIKQGLLIGIESVRNWKIGMPKEGLIVYARVARLTWKERVGSVNMGITDSSGYSN